MPRWRAAGEFSEIPDEVRLIGITAGRGGASPWRLRACLLERLQRVLKARDARKPFWRQAHVIEKAALEMTARCVRGKRETIDRYLAARPGDGLDRKSHSAIHL